MSRNKGPIIRNKGLAGGFLTPHVRPDNKTLPTGGSDTDTLGFWPVGPNNQNA